MMSQLAAYLSVLPMAAGAILPSDLIQKLFIPSRRSIYLAVRYHRSLSAASALLWLAALLLWWDTSASATHLWISALLLMIFGLFTYVATPTMVFKPIAHPILVTAAEAAEFLPDDEEVIGLELGGESRAYPIKMMLKPHVVSDTLGGAAVAITYCVLSNSSVAFQSVPPALACDRVRHAPVAFRVVGMWNNNLILYDTANRNLVQQFIGAIAAGEDAGRELTCLPTVVTTFGVWKAVHPQTLVLRHQPRSVVDRLVTRMMIEHLHLSYRQLETTLFPVANINRSLPIKERVLGVSIAGESRAYVLSRLADRCALNDSIGGVPLLVLVDRTTGWNIILRRTCAGTGSGTAGATQASERLTLDFESIEGEPLQLRDSLTASRWDWNGRCVSGELQGRQLEPHLHISTAYWFSWAFFHPETSVYPPLP